MIRCMQHIRSMYIFAAYMYTNFICMYIWHILFFLTFSCLPLLSWYTTWKIIWKNRYVRYMSKCIKYIFSKSCILKYISHIFYIYIYIYICQNIYLTYTWHMFNWRQNIFSWPKVVCVAFIFHFHGGCDYFPYM